MKSSPSRFSMSFRLQRQRAYSSHNPPRGWLSLALLGSVLTFVSQPASTRTLEATVRGIVTFWITLFAGWLGVQTPSAQPIVSALPPPVSVIRYAPRITIVQKAEKPLPTGMHLRPRLEIHDYVYRFSGVVTAQGKPFPLATVFLKLNSQRGNKSQGAVSEENGTYTVEAIVPAAADEPVDWTIEAYTPEFERIEFTGRQIVDKSNRVIELPQNFDFTQPATAL